MSELRIVDRRAASVAKTKMVGPSGAKVAVRAQRPTFEAAPNILQLTKLQVLGRRANKRTRELANILLEIRDYNPDAAKAKENIVSLANPGYSVDVFFSASADGEPKPDMEGARLVRRFCQRLCGEYNGAAEEQIGQNDDYTGLNRYIDLVHQTLFTFGAVASEVQLTESLDDIVDVFPVDPNWVDFGWDPANQRIIPGLNQSGQFVPLDPIRFRYIGKDPDTNDPSGHSPLLAVVDTVFFQQQFMRELQAIAHQTNSPRLDVKIVEETAMNALRAVRPDLFTSGDAAALQAEIGGYISDIQTVIESLEPDDAFVHLDSVEAQFIGPQGTAIPVKDILAAISQMMVSGVKQLPMLLGRNEGATTTHATVQWQVFILQLAAYQRISAALISWLLNLYLRIQGRQSYVVFKYEQHKTSDELLDAQAFDINISAYGAAVDRGWITDDEAATALFGHSATGTPKPPPAPPPSEPAPVSPPRTMGTTIDDGTRAISERVADLPHWLQSAHHAMLRDYNNWRMASVMPKFVQATRRVHTVSAEMTDTEAQRWIFNQLKLVDADRNRLNESLRQGGRSASSAAIQEQLRAINKAQQVKITNKKLVRAIDDQAKTSAHSIFDTYNDELRGAIQTQFELANRRDIADQIGKLRQVITGLLDWERLRNAWKSAQVALSETQGNVTRAINEFFNRNEVEGEAEVYPYSSTQDICADYIAANPYPDMKTALAQTDLPAHTGCPHYVRLVNGGTIADGQSIWVGGD